MSSKTGDAKERMAIRARNSKPSEESSTTSAPESESKGELAVDDPSVGTNSSSENEIFDIFVTSTVQILRLVRSR